ncbi:MAG TPA: hypothetical protein VGJ88_05395 [Thermoanaerobaculia bacterium]
MNKTKQFAFHFAAAVLLVGTSAFAESRHSNATRGGERHGGDRSTVQRQSGQRDTSRSYQQQRTETRNWNNNNQSRSYDRNNTRNYNRNNTRGYESNRGYTQQRSYDNRGYSNRGYDNRGYSNRGYSNRGYTNRGYAPSYGRGNAYYHDGRISRIERWNGGYRIYVGGAAYPFFVPEARFSLFPFRVGLSIHIGGYYNPLGYYDYYDAGPYGYYPTTVTTAGDLRGVVDSVDYRRGSLVIRDDASGNFVTVMMRGNDPRFDSLRNGDYVDLSGDWVRGYFEAVSVNNIDGGNDGYYRR